MKQQTELPLIYAGPIVRRCDKDGVTLWFATREPLIGHIFLYDNHSIPLGCLDFAQAEQIRVGKNVWITLANVRFNIPEDGIVHYSFSTQSGSMTELLPHLSYESDLISVEGRLCLTLKLTGKAEHVLHGSCRCPHTDNLDALPAVDRRLAGQEIEDRADILMLSGDQIYADEVAGPSLHAIHILIDRLGLPNETFAHLSVADSDALYRSDLTYYHRSALLPSTQQSSRWGMNKNRSQPIFTSTDSDNHLMTFGEFFVMYLLVWSSSLWDYLSEEWEVPPSTVAQDAEHLTRWNTEVANMRGFISGLKNVQRLLAHLSTYMIFDDHDITDDWNLTIGWEKAAYEHPDARQIIGNGLFAYWLCQGWGNDPKRFNREFKQPLREFLNHPTFVSHNDVVQQMHRCEDWHYTIDSMPKMVVLDTRTRRWRSESKMNKPSGLMDWEALIEFHQQLVDQDKVVIVSPAPMFGVKFIEMLQRAVTQLGHPLAVDAENWMAHPGAANTLISIFTHTKTPKNFVILSGDVHYSFTYDIQLRFRKAKPNIYQITCSGIKNTFPSTLLKVCDYADRWLYSPRSPLNWLTKRKRLKIFKRYPTTSAASHLVNHSALGEVRLDSEGKPKLVKILLSDGTDIEFPQSKSI
ncbi:alkaline phosphatase family protein [Vibrio sp.]|nr:alkaline phosphatase family protein [Vibrio sp.]